MDLFLLTLFRGRIRTELEFRALFASAPVLEKHNHYRFDQQPDVDPRRRAGLTRRPS